MDVERPGRADDRSVTGLLLKLLSDQFRPAGPHRSVAPTVVDKSNAGHRGHTLAGVRPASVQRRGQSSQTFPFCQGQCGRMNFSVMPSSAQTPRRE